MVKIYGCSDDLVEIEGSKYKENEIDCYDSNVRIWFSDGTVILVGYSKPGLGIWWIEVEQTGDKSHKLTICNDEDAEIYSDIFETESEIFRHEVVKPKEDSDA